MNGNERRSKIIEILENSTVPVPGVALAKQLDVSRQIIVQDIALIRATNKGILSTNKGYVLDKHSGCSRILKVHHENDQVETELTSIVDMGGTIQDVFVYHKVYGVIKADLNLHSRRDIAAYMKELASGKSSLLMNVTSGYHYHTVLADSKEILDEIQQELDRLGFLAPLQEYEPVDFWEQ